MMHWLSKQAKLYYSNVVFIHNCGIPTVIKQQFCKFDFVFFFESKNVQQTQIRLETLLHSVTSIIAAYRWVRVTLTCISLSHVHITIVIT